MLLDHDANLQLAARGISTARSYRQVDNCYRISHPIASRGLLARLWASLINWL